MAISKKLSDFFSRFKLGDGKLFGYQIGDGKFGDIPLYSSYNKNTPVTLSDSLNSEAGSGPAVGILYQNAGGADNPNEYISKYSDYNPLVESAVSNRDEAIAAANKSKEAVYADAQASYAQNKATYGNNAEQLSQMGLSGGGYGDYLNSQAYAQQRATMGTADTAEQTAIKEANKTYGDYVNSVKAQVSTDNREFQSEADTMYGKILDAAGAGQSSEYVDAALAKYGDHYGWTEEQKQALRNVADNYKATYSIDLENGSKTEVNIGNSDDIQTQINEGIITTKAQLDAVSKYAGDQYDTMLASIQEKTYNSIIEKIDGGTVFDKGTIQQLVDSGDINDTQASALHKKQIIDEISTLKEGAIDNILETMGDFPLTDSDKADINKAADERKAAIEKEIQEKYQPIINAVESGAFTNQDPMTANGAAVGSAISDLILRGIADGKAKAKTDTAVTGATGIEYYWNTKTFSLGKKATITLSDGTSDEVFLKGYAVGKVKKELGSGKEGQVKQASNGSYYVYDGTSSWVMLKNVDEGTKLKSN